MTFNEGKEPEVAYEEMKLAYEHGVNFFDNSESYGETTAGWERGGVSEEIMGEAVKIGIEKGEWARMDLVISTKLMWGGRGTVDTVNSVGLSRKHLVEGMHASLERMQLDYVDLVFCHRPDDRTPIWETVRAMNFLIDQGLAFYWGTSEWSEAQLAEALHVSEKLNMIPPLFEQCEYSMLTRDIIESELTPFYPALGTTVWSPLAGGVLSGKYGTDQSQWKEEWRGTSMEQAEVAEALKPIAEGVGCSLAQLALAWCCANPNVSTVIMGASRMSQLEDNLGALAVLPLLTDDVLEQIEGVLGNKPEPSGTSTMAMVSGRRGGLEEGTHWLTPKL